jgi:surface antigen
MRNMLGFGSALLAGFLCAAPVAAQTDLTTSPPVGTCRPVTGQAEIDGVLQPIAGLACLQPDGTWQIVQNVDGSWVVPSDDYAYYYAPWYWSGPWYWGPIVVGGSATFVFVDRFHHFHRFDHLQLTFHRTTTIVRGGLSSPHPSGASRMWGGMGGMGGGFRRR